MSNRRRMHAQIEGEPMTIYLRALLLASTLITPAFAADVANDPYIWLEQVDSPEAMTWVRAENAKTLAVLEKDARYDGFLQSARAIAQAQDRIPMPHVIRGQVYNFWQDAAHVRGIWRRTSPASYATAAPEWTTVLDLDAVAGSEKANWVWKGADCEQPAELTCMVQLSDGGEDAVTIREFDLNSGRFVANGFTLPHGKQDAAWEDAKTLLVAREWKSGEMTKSGYPYVIKRLARGQPLASAKELFRGKPEDVSVDLLALDDGAGHHANIITRGLTTFETEYHLLTPKGVRKLALPLKVSVEAMVQGRVLVSLAQDWTVNGTEFAQGSLVALDLKDLALHPSEPKPVLVYAPGARETFNSAAATRDSLIVTTLQNVQGRAAVYHPQADGSFTHTPIALPDNSAIEIVDADLHGDSAFLDVTGFLQPTTLWSADVHRSTAAGIKALEPKFDASRDVVHQFEAVSTDGARIPYFVIHRSDMPLDGSNPTILNAYGGFQISRTPFYAGIMGKLWLERGGVFVLANIRGGGEFGPAWHEAGLKTHRQIIYNDFVAVARDLMARKITSPRRLGIEGGSNGGLLMGVQFTQHPELWNAVDIQVPLLDMLRFEQIAAGSSWVGEYGSVSVPEERAFLESISPYGNLKRGVNYPEPFIWTTTKDDRVGPQHARKFAARLAEFGIPYLYYEVIEGGHGAGANLDERARTNALEMTYFTRKLMDN
jgi:prolyl oligopeptidase